MSGSAKVDPVARDLWRPDDLAWQIFRGADAISAGRLTPNALRSLAWTRLRYGVYADSRLDADHALACRAVALRLPPGAVIAGRSAAFLHGVDHAASFSDDVHVIMPPPGRLGSRRGLRVHSAVLDGGDIEDSGWCARTTPGRTAWDIAAWHDVLTAVPLIDVLLREDLVDPSELDKLAILKAGHRGNRKVRRAFALADGRAQSPPESVLRVRLAMAGLPDAVAQCPISVASGLILHSDLGWPQFKVAVEYDGQWHATADQLHRDRRRLNQLAAAGWLVLHVTSERMRRDFAGLLREIRTALASRGWRP